MIEIPALILAFTALLLVLVLAWKGFVIVPQAETTVIERLGRFHRTLHTGINVIWPFFDKPRLVRWRYQKTDEAGKSQLMIQETSRIDLREQVYDFPRQGVITRDNVNVDIDALLYFQVTDPKNAVYEIANLPYAIEKLTQTTLRNVVGELELDETLSGRDTINAKLRSILDDATDKWGVKVNRVEIQDIVPPADILDQMEKQMRAERDRRAAILIAEGRKTAEVLEAEGHRDAIAAKAEGTRQALVLRAAGEAEARVATAEAEARAIERVREAVPDESDPLHYLVAVRYVDTLNSMVSGKDNKVVYLPYEASGVLSSLGGMKDLLSGKNE